MIAVRTEKNCAEVEMKIKNVIEHIKIQDNDHNGFTWEITQENGEVKRLCGRRRKNLSQRRRNMNAIQRSFIKLGNTI